MTKAIQTGAAVVHRLDAGPQAVCVTLASPAIAALASPGQFVQVACADDSCADPLLPRPISIAIADSCSGTITLYVKAVGRGTRWLTQLAVGDTVSLLGPLGKGFVLPARLSPGGSACRNVLVGGGVGIAPILFLAQALRAAGHDPLILLGAACEQSLAFRRELAACGEVRVATDDGSCGRQGFVTSLLEEALAESPPTESRGQVFSCGPRPMMRAVAAIAARHGAACQVSMEEHMACGVGACLVCACAMRATGHGRYARVCADGPVFPAEEVDWDA